MVSFEIGRWGMVEMGEDSGRGWGMVSLGMEGGAGGWGKWEKVEELCVRGTGVGEGRKW